MGRFGQNPYQENMFRIVFAPSRMSLVCGTFDDGSTGGRWMPLYGHLGDKWILEKWLTPFEFCRMTREQWDREMLVNGPFPDRGEYEHCHTFETCTPAEANLDKLIMWINEGKNRSYDEIRAACEAKYQSEDRDVANMQESVIRDALPAFGTVPLVGRGGGRGTKTDRIRKTAAELGLPTRGGMSSNRSLQHVA